MDYMELNLSRESSSNDRLNHPLYSKIVDRISGYLDYCDERLNGNSFDLEEDIHSLYDFYNKLNRPDVLYLKEDVVEELNGLIKAQVTPVADYRLSAQKSTLKNNRAFVRHGKDAELEWYYLPVDSKPSEEHMEALENVPLDYIVDIDWLGEALNSDVNLFDYIENKITQKIENIIKIMELSAPWTNKPENKNYLGLEKQVGIFVKGISDLAEVCNKLSSNLPEYLFTFIKDDSKINAMFKKIAVELVDEQLACINDAFLPEVVISKKEKKAQKLAKYTLGKVNETSDNYHVEKTENQTETPENNITEEEPKELDLGEYDLNFPWMKNGSLSKAMLYKGTKQDVVLVKAMPKKLEKVSQISRDGLKKNLDGDDKIDITIKQVIKRIGEGVMPYEDSNSVKGLKTDQKDIRPEYKDEKIWYTFDISPNSPRVYFTIKSASEYIELNNNKTIMLVVLAESDKARQIDALTVITKLSRKTLSARGAGSV